MWLQENEADCRLKQLNNPESLQSFLDSSRSQYGSCPAPCNATLHQQVGLQSESHSVAYIQKGALYTAAAVPI